MSRAAPKVLFLLTNVAIKDVRVELLVHPIRAFFFIFFYRGKTGESARKRRERHIRMVMIDMVDVIEDEDRCVIQSSPRIPIFRDQARFSDEICVSLSVRY